MEQENMERENMEQENIEREDMEQENIAQEDKGRENMEQENMERENIEQKDTEQEEKMGGRYGHHRDRDRRDRSAGWAGRREGEDRRASRGSHCHGGNRGAGKDHGHHGSHGAEGGYRLLLKSEGTRLLFIGSRSCTRHKGVQKLELEQEGKLSFLCLEEIDWITGRYLSLIEEAAGELLREKPKELILFGGCQVELLSTDYGEIARSLSEKYGIPVSYHRGCHLTGYESGRGEGRRAAAAGHRDGRNPEVAPGRRDDRNPEIAAGRRDGRNPGVAAGNGEGGRAAAAGHRDGRNPEVAPGRGEDRCAENIESRRWEVTVGIGDTNCNFEISESRKTAPVPVGALPKLWRVLPPLLADVFGFLDLVNRTDGLGVIDDCGAYRLTRERSRGDGLRAIHSEIGEAEVTGGTREKVLEAFRAGAGRFRPSFALLAAGPCAAMIGTDLAEIAEQIRSESGLPAAAVAVTGQKTYDVGISETLLALCRLFCREMPREKHAVNVLGANVWDWQEEHLAGVRSELESAGFSVIAAPGGRTERTELERMGAASVNLVVTVSGLAAAQYMEKEFGIPYAVAAPFGHGWKEKLCQAEGGGKLLRQRFLEEASGSRAESFALSAGKPDEESLRCASSEDGTAEHAGRPDRMVADGQNPGQDGIAADGQIAGQTEYAGDSGTDGSRSITAGDFHRILIIAEQVTGNTLREVLCRRGGVADIRVATFYKFAKAISNLEDQKIKSEKEARRLIQEGGFDLIIGDPLLRRFAPRETRWVSLPHKAFHLYGDCEEMPLLFGDHLEVWIKAQGIRQ